MGGNKFFSLEGDIELKLSIRKVLINANFGESKTRRLGLVNNGILEQIWVDVFHRNEDMKVEVRWNKMIVHFSKVFGLLLLITLLSACRQYSKPKVDVFYTEKGEWDSARIPFIKPYEAIIFGKKDGWGMGLMALNGGDSMIGHIREATVVNGFILVHSGSTLLMGNEINESWWVVSPSRKIEKGFSDHWQYWIYLKNLGFIKEPRLHDMNVIASYYEDHETMVWDESINTSDSPLSKTFLMTY